MFAAFYLTLMDFVRHVVVDNEGMNQIIKLITLAVSWHLFSTEIPKIVVFSPAYVVHLN